MSNRYKLPPPLQGLVVEATEEYSGCAGARPKYKISGTDIEIVMPVGFTLEPIRPSEPPPGVYRIPDGYAIRWGGDLPHPWLVILDEAFTDRAPHPMNWTDVCDLVGPSIANAIHMNRAEMD